MTGGAILLFFSYAWLPLRTSGIYNSPDETAVAFFSQPSEKIFDIETPDAKYRAELGGLVHPRSMIVSDGKLVPSGFLGLPWLLSLIRRAGFSLDTAELIVPILAVLAVFAWGSTVSRFFENKWIGRVAGLLLAIHPAWIYFANRGLLPNVAFVSLLIFSAWAFTRASTSNRIRLLTMFLGGLFLGLAIFVRTNEAMWILPVVLCIALRSGWVHFLGVRTAPHRPSETYPVASERFPLQSIYASVLGFALPIAVMFVVNANVYGNALSFGYLLKGDALPIAVSTPFQIPQFLNSSILYFLFPFGIHEMNILRNMWNYGFSLFWPFTVLGALGVVLFVKRGLGHIGQMGRIGPILVAAAVSAYLLILYGSWNVTDNITPGAVTIGVSYVRYWLPIFVLATIPCAFAIWRIGVWFSEHAPVKYRRELARESFPPIAFYLLFFYGLFLSWSFVASGSEGLRATQNTLSDSLEKRAFILERTTESDVVITDRDDKVLFPERQVVFPFRSPATDAHLSFLVEKLNDNNGHLFYWGQKLPLTDARFYQENILSPQNLVISEEASRRDFTLYRISKFPDSLIP